MGRIIMKHAWSSGEAWGKTSAAIVGGGLLFGAVLLGAGAALTHAGATVSASATAAVWLAFLTWPTIAVWVLLARDARRAWVGTATAFACAAALWFLARTL